MNLKGVLLGGILGAGVGFYLAKVLLEEKYLEIANKEVEDAKRFYAALYPPSDEKQQELLDSAIDGIHDAAVDASNAIEEYLGGSINPTTLMADITEAVARNKLLELQNSPEVELPPRVKAPVPLPVEPSPKVDYNKKSVINKEAEDAVENFPTQNEETLKAPYQISFSVFDDDEDGYQKISLAYFVGDEIVVDETVIDEAEAVIQPRDVEKMVTKSLLKAFNSSEDDPDVIYVRNEKLSMDFEITRSPDSYAADVSNKSE